MNDKMREALEAVMQILGAAPELNPSNYDHDQACALNAAATEAYNLIDSALAQQPESEPLGYVSDTGLHNLRTGENSGNCALADKQSSFFPHPVYASGQPTPQVPEEKSYKEGLELWAARIKEDLSDIVEFNESSESAESFTIATTWGREALLAEIEAEIVRITAAPSMADGGE